MPQGARRQGKYKESWKLEKNIKVQKSEKQ